MTSRLNKNKKWILALAAVLALGALAWWMSRPPAVAAVSPQQGLLVGSLQFSARVATLSRVELGATVTGRVREVLAAAGAELQAGQVLARLEDDEPRAALAQAEAAERQAAARLEGLRGTGRITARAALAQVDSVGVAARAELQRTESLVAQGFLSQARLDEAQRAASVALAQQAGAQAQLQALGDEGSDIAQAQAQLALARASSVAARARLAQSALLAPAAGRLLERRVEPGQIVQPGRALFDLALRGPLQLVAQVDERYLEQLRVGQAAAVLADAYPGQRFAAQLISIAPVIDALRGAVELKFSVAQPPAFLREDMTLSVEVETARRERAWVLPLQALRPALGEPADPARAAVWVVHEGRVAARALRVGLRTLSAIEVIEGLDAGDQVLIGPAPAPGQRVRADTQAAALLLKRKVSGNDGGAALSNAMGR